MLYRHPLSNPVILRDFLACPAEYARWGFPGHEGLDYQADTGEPIYACSPGLVYRVEKSPSAHPYGIHVRISHQLPAQGLPALAETVTVKTVYAHLSWAAVEVGQSLGVGQPLGEAGSTGNSSGPHLHLTIKAEGIQPDAYAPGFDPSLRIVNPWNFLPPLPPFAEKGSSQPTTVTSAPIARARILVDSLLIRSRPSTRSAVVSNFVKDDIINVYALSGCEFWARTDLGWVALTHDSFTLAELISAEGFSQPAGRGN